MLVFGKWTRGVCCKGSGSTSESVEDFLSTCEYYSDIIVLYEIIEI
jgi:hypothetical protein